MKTRPKPFTVFAVCNAALAMALGVLLLADRALHFYKGPAQLSEFLLYGLAIAAVAAIGARVFRRERVSVAALVAMQVGILGHIAGGFVRLNGVRLYDDAFLGVPYDNYVHTLNGLAGALLTDCLLPPMRGPIPRGVVVALVLMGAGSIVEMIEYVAYFGFGANGVGGYDNNMRDLIANTAGALVYLAGKAVFSIRLAPIRSRAREP